MKLWKRWTNADLQAAIEDLEPGLLERLEEIIPALSPEGGDAAQVYLKSNLIRIFQAFAPSDAFKKEEFRRQCLNRLPEDEILLLAGKYGLHAQSFDEALTALVRLGWTESSAATFADHFCLPGHFLPTRRHNPTRHVDIPAPSRTSPTTIDAPYKTLKDYQFGVLGTAKDKLAIPKARIMVQMPTGSGKTRTTMELVTEHLNGDSESNVVVWLVHSEELCEQALQCFCDVAAHVLHRNVRAYRAWGNYGLPDSTNDACFVVGGFPKLYSHLKKQPEVFREFADRVGLLIIDEAHRAVAPTYNQVTKALIGSKTKVVGLSATPGRTDIDETAELSEFFFGVKVGIEADGDESAISLLRRKRVLSNARCQALYTSVTYELSAAERSYLERSFDYPPGFLKRLAADEVRNVEILSRLLRVLEDNKRVLFFGCSVEHSRFVAAMALYFGYRAAHIDGTTGKSMRANVVDGFRSGDIQLLCNYGILATGFDAPKTDVVFISRPTQSVVLYSQMIGRGLRGPAIGGTAECNIIDVRDNIVGMGDQEKVYEYFEDYWFT